MCKNIYRDADRWISSQFEKEIVLAYIAKTKNRRKYFENSNFCVLPAPFYFYTVVNSTVVNIHNLVIRIGDCFFSSMWLNSIYKYIPWQKHTSRKNPRFLRLVRTRPWLRCWSILLLHCPLAILVQLITDNQVNQVILFKCRIFIDNDELWGTEFPRPHILAAKGWSNYDNSINKNNTTKILQQHVC